MIFEKAYKELMAGKKIRRKEWEVLMHMRLVNGEIKTYKGEYTDWYDDAHSLFLHPWQVVDDENRENLLFVSAIDQLRQKKCIKRLDWVENNLEQFVFIDNGKFALCKQVEFDFMPTWSCLISDDWHIVK